MELYRAIENKKLIDLQQEFTDAAWYDFHNKNISDGDDFYKYFHEYIDNAVIYKSECEEILKGNSEYSYEDHDLFGRPNNVEQAAYACLYDYLMEHPDTVTFAEMEEVLNEK